jgi:hypothetical protein
LLREQKHASFLLLHCCESENTLHFSARTAARAKTRLIFAPALLRERKHASFLLLHCCVSENAPYFSSCTAARAKTRFIFAPAPLRERKHGSFLLPQCGEREKELNFPIFGRLGAGRYDGGLGFLAGASGERGGSDLGDDFVDLADGGLQLRGGAVRVTIALNAALVRVGMAAFMRS